MHKIIDYLRGTDVGEDPVLWIRRKVFSTLVVGFILIGVLSLAYEFHKLVALGRAWYIGAWCVLLIIMGSTLALKQMSFELRGQIVSVLVYFSGMTLLIMHGSMMGGEYLLLLFSFISLVYCGATCGLKALFISCLSVFVLLYPYSKGWLPYWGSEYSHVGLSLVQCLSFSLTSFMLIGSVGAMLRALEDALQSQSDLVGQLRQEVGVRRNAELKLSQKELMLQSVLSTSPSGIGLVEDGCITWMSGRLKDMLEFQENDLLTVESVFVGNDDLLFPRDSSPLDEPHSILLETDVVSRNGRAQYCLVSVSHRGKDQSGYIFSVLDISENKRLLRERREAEQRYEILFRRAALPCLLVNPRDGRIADANDKAVLFYGYGHDLIGMNICNINTIDDEKLQKCMNYILKSNEGCFQFPHRLASGEIREVEVNTGMVKFRNEDYIFSIVNDISEELEIRKNLERARTMAERAAQAKSQFLATVSHELRTPLNGVLGMLQLLMETDLNDEQLEYVNMSLGAGNGLVNLISDILDLSRMEAGKLTLAEERVELCQLIEQMNTVFAVEALQKGLEFSIDCNVEEPVLADGSRLAQILFNLIGNAIKFTSEGGVKVSLELLHRDNHAPRLLIGVEDTGIGIGTDFIDELFTPFTQEDPSHSRGYQGAGLGLGIVKKFVDLMGGNISVSSASGEGTEVYVVVKVKKYQPTSDNVTLPAPTTSARKRIKTVAIAEDNMPNRVALSGYLSKNGFDVISAADGSELIKKIENKGVDVILMDVQMPKMDGLEATRVIRSGVGGIASTVPIIAITAHAMSGDKEKFIKLGMNNYIAKPIDMRNLLDLLAELEQD
ncbi:MAG: response regulator [Desulfovibrio sp.]